VRWLAAPQQQQYYAPAQQAPVYAQPGESLHAIL